MCFDHFGLIAPIYARLGYYAQAERLAHFADLPTNGMLLDAGGGTGRVARSLRNKIDQIVLADESRGMLRFATPTSLLNPTTTVTEALPFADETFERVIIVDAFHHVAEQGKTARELMRVLKFGGKLVIEEPDIRSFGGVLIALAEKLLLMRSHFLSPSKIAELFPNARVEVHAENGTAWVIVNK